METGDEKYVLTLEDDVSFRAPFYSLLGRYIRGLDAVDPMWRAARFDTYGRSGRRAEDRAAAGSFDVYRARAADKGAFAVLVRDRSLVAEMRERVHRGFDTALAQPAVNGTYVVRTGLRVSHHALYFGTDIQIGRRGGQREV